MFGTASARLPRATALPPVTMGAMLDHARAARNLPALVESFTASIAPNGFDRHLCVALESNAPRPLFGHDALKPDEPVLHLPVATWNGARCAVRLAGRAQPVDAAMRASLAGRAEVYATFGFALLQRAHDVVTAAGLGLAERQCLAGLLLGHGEGAIAARLGIDPLAVSGHIARAIERLGTGTRAEAVAIAARRGLLAGFPADCRISLAPAQINHS